MAETSRAAVEEFYYHEADLLDDRRFVEWLDLFTDDARYWMPVRENRLSGPDPVAGELSVPGGNCYFDDTKDSLRIRVERLYVGTAWAETPPSRTRHLITNVRITREAADEIETRTNFLVYRTRLEHDRDLFVGTRTDVLRRVAGGFRIARRTVVLDQAILDAKNISVFL